MALAIVIFSILAVAVIFIYVLKNVLPVTSFLYADARVHARSAFLIKEKQWSELSENKSLAELTNSLRDTDYSEELEKSRDIRSFHVAVEKSFIDSVLEIISMAPKKVKPLLDAYLMFWEAKMLKSVYRTRFVGIEKEQANKLLSKDLVFAVGTIDSNLIKHLLETETTADFNVVMASTLYSDVFSKKYETLEEFEVALDSFVLEYFAGVTNKTKMYEGKHIINMLNMKFDILNILALLKSEIRKVPTQERKKLLIKNQTDLAKRFDKLVEAKDLAEFVELCKGLPYYDPLKEALDKYNKDKSLAHFERDLYKYYKEFVTKSDLEHTLGPYPLFSYLIKKEIEFKNLLTISKCIDAKFKPEEMQVLII